MAVQLVAYELTPRGKLQVLENKIETAEYSLKLAREMYVVYEQDAEDGKSVLANPAYSIAQEINSLIELIDEYQAEKAALLASQNHG